MPPHRLGGAILAPGVFGLVSPFKGLPLPLRSPPPSPSPLLSALSQVRPPRAPSYSSGGNNTRTSTISNSSTPGTLAGGGLACRCLSAFTRSFGGGAGGAGKNVARRPKPERCPTSPRAGSFAPSAGCTTRRVSARMDSVIRVTTCGSALVSGWRHFLGAPCGCIFHTRRSTPGGDTNASAKRRIQRSAVGPMISVGVEVASATAAAAAAEIAVTNAGDDGRLPPSVRKFEPCGSPVPVPLPAPWISPRSLLECPTVTLPTRPATELLLHCFRRCLWLLTSSPVAPPMPLPRPPSPSSVVGCASLAVIFTPIVR
mmetsp:Transcript_30060/g.75312  ORF Transcript_30060/g.75312 Transcript_30060/m.75312 type:complete len:314 (+) Transcript_30060:91-1032(+)